jgi:hypothetical protein
MISVERTTRNRHFLRGSNGAIGSTTTRTRTRIGILPSSNKYSKKNIDFYCFVTSL